MKTIICRTTKNNEYAEGCEYAIIKLTPELLERIRCRLEVAKELAAKDHELWQIYFWAGDGQVTWIDYDKDHDQELLSRCDDEGWVVLDDEGRLASDSIARTDLEQMVVNACGQVHWMCYDGYSDMEYQTTSFDLKDLEKVVGG